MTARLSKTRVLKALLEGHEERRDDLARALCTCRNDQAQFREGWNRLAEFLRKRASNGAEE